MAFQKTATVEKYRTHGTDTGSAQVQVAILTENINYLTTPSGLTRKTITVVADCSRWSADARDCLLT